MRLWGGAVDGAFPAATPFSDLRVITQDDGKGSRRVCDSGNTNDLGRIDMAKGGVFILFVFSYFSAGWSCFCVSLPP